MSAPLKLRLEYLASTFGIENLGMAWIQTNPDGTRSLVLNEAPEGIPFVVGTNLPPLTEAEVEHALQALYR